MLIEGAQIVAIGGWRCAAAEKLLIEGYPDMPIELAMRSGPTSPCGARVDAGLIRNSRALGLTEWGSALGLNRPGDDGDGVSRPLGHVIVAIEDGEIMVSRRSFLGYLGKETSTREMAAAGQFATCGLGQAHSRETARTVFVA
jgi:hypothetical protein